MHDYKIIFYLLSVLFAPQVVFAQIPTGSNKVVFDGTPETVPLVAPAPLKKMTDEEIAAKAKRLGLDRNSRQFKVMSGQTKPLEPIDFSKKKLLAHYVGDKGVEFSSPAQVKAAMQQYLPSKAERRAILDQAYEEAASQLKERYSNMIDFPKCSKDSTDRMQIGVNKNQRSKVITMDILFINQEDIPELPDEKIGSKTQFKIVDKNIGNNQAAIGMGISCVPTRFRSTNQSLFIDEGLNALKNYDDDFSGNGYLHQTLKDRL